MEIKVVDHYVLNMYSRIRSLLEGVGVLLEAQLPEEAIHLSRQMFSDSLYLMEIAREGPNRAALILGAILQSLNEIENLERQALSLRVHEERDVERTREHLRDRRRQIEAYRARHGIGRLKTFPDEKQLATSHKRLEEYIDFQFAHRVIHRADIAQFARSKRSHQGFVQISLRNPDQDWFANVAAFAMRCALHAHAAVASIFGWTETPAQQIEQLLTDVEADLT